MRIVIDKTVKRDEIGKRAYRLDWNLIDVIQATDETPHETIYRTRETKTLIHLINDHVLDTLYFVLDGPGVTEWARRIREEFEVVDEEDVDRLIASGKVADVKQAVSAAALLAPKKFSRKFFDYFQRAFGHKSASVRDHAIVATGYVGWRELEEPLQQLAENDSDAEVRESARVMLEAMQEEK